MYTTKVKLVGKGPVFYYDLRVPVQVSAATDVESLTRAERQAINRGSTRIVFTVPRLDANAVYHVASRLAREELGGPDPAHVTIEPRVHGRHLYAQALSQWMRTFGKPQAARAVRTILLEYRATDVNLMELVRACEDSGNARLDPVEVVMELGAWDAGPPPMQRLRRRLHHHWWTTRAQVGRSLAYYRDSSPVIRNLMLRAEALRG